jgi:DNA-binding transcriptional ArsR family regulator
VDELDKALEDLREQAETASRLLKVMGNGHRLRILCHLLVGEKSVGELEHKVTLSQSALSQHLARLRRDNLVQTRREAQMIYYSLVSQEVKGIIQTLASLYSKDADSAARSAVNF